MALRVTRVSSGSVRTAAVHVWSPSLQRLAPVVVRAGLCEDRLKQYKRGGVNEEAFIGDKFCRITAAEEPSEIMWENIDAKIISRRARRSGSELGTPWHS